jgi:hypothetical protein
MEKLIFPDFVMPPRPEKKVPIEVWRALNDDFVRRLKEGGLYGRIRNSPSHRPSDEPFRLKDEPCKS